MSFPLYRNARKYHFYCSYKAEQSAGTLSLPKKWIVILPFLEDSKRLAQASNWKLYWILSDMPDLEAKANEKTG